MRNWATGFVIVGEILILEKSDKEINIYTLLQNWILTLKSYPEHVELAIQRLPINYLNPLYFSKNNEMNFVASTALTAPIMKRTCF